MSITDEMREYANRFKNSHDEWSGIGDDLTAIADRIDAEHEAKVSYWQGASYKDGYDEGFASADDWLAQHEDAMAEHGWVRLPKDADGVPIHIGDVMEWNRKPFAALVITITKDGWEMWDGEHGRAVPVELARHHHAPTVEDVLREFGDWYAHTKGGCDEDGIIAEYAAKLRLAEEDA